MLLVSDVVIKDVVPGALVASLVAVLLVLLSPVVLINVVEPVPVVGAESRCRSRTCCPKTCCLPHGVSHL